jgi:dTDP-D-glucose 4,6-dehydratase
VPKIENTMSELGWKPQVSMRDALVKIFDAYKDNLADAKDLIPERRQAPRT